MCFCTQLLNCVLLNKPIVSTIFDGIYSARNNVIPDRAIKRLPKT